MPIQRLCVFCGSSNGRRPLFHKAAADFGALIAQCDIDLIYGGGHIGLMGAIADAALAAGGRVIGVIPRALAEKEVAHRGLTELYVVDSMHQRKELMAELSDAFIAMPGGYGTLEEFFEAVTWTQLGVHRKPCGLLNVDGYFDPILTACDRALDEGFLLPQNRNLIISCADGADLIRRLESAHLPPTPTWVLPEQT